MENFSERNIKELKKEIKNVKIKTDKNNLKCPYCGSKHIHINSYKNILLKNRVFDDKIEFLNIKFKRKSSKLNSDTSQNLDKICDFYVELKELDNNRRKIYY